jgi:hypothetical protein
MRREIPDRKFPSRQGSALVAIKPGEVFRQISKNTRAFDLALLAGHGQAPNIALGVLTTYERKVRDALILV